MTKASPTLTSADAWLLAALTEGKGASLRDLVHDCDWLKRDVPTFDEVSYGLPRLAQRNLITVEGAGGAIRVTATAEAREIRKGMKPHPHGIVAAMEQALGTSPAAGKGDRSLGRMQGLSRSDWERAVAAHDAWSARLTRPFVVVARALSRWQNRGTR